jgi:hypothetical protein
LDWVGGDFSSVFWRASKEDGKDYREGCGEIIAHIGANYGWVSDKKK